MDTSRARDYFVDLQARIVATLEAIDGAGFGRGVEHLWPEVARAARRWIAAVRLRRDRPATLRHAAVAAAA